MFSATEGCVSRPSTAERVPPELRPIQDSRYARSEAEVVIGLLPTSDPTEVPAYLRFGDFTAATRPSITAPSPGTGAIGMVPRW